MKDLRAVANRVMRGGGELSVIFHSYDYVQDFIHLFIYSSILLAQLSTDDDFEETGELKVYIILWVLSFFFFLFLERSAVHVGCTSTDLPVRCAFPSLLALRFSNPFFFYLPFRLPRTFLLPSAGDVWREWGRWRGQFLVTTSKTSHLAR